MTVYQELQLNQAGSKNLIRSCADQKEKRKHIAVYLLKISLTVAFWVNLGFETSQSVWVMIGIFGILAVGPHMANQVPSVVGFVINSVCIFVMLVLGCHNVIYFNHATFVLTYLLLYGNDVNGVVYGKRVLGLMLGGIWAVSYTHLTLPTIRLV